MKLRAYLLWQTVLLVHCISSVFPQLQVTSFHFLYRLSYTGSQESLEDLSGNSEHKVGFLWWDSGHHGGTAGSVAASLLQDLWLDPGLRLLHFSCVCACGFPPGYSKMPLRCECVSHPRCISTQSSWDRLRSHHNPVQENALPEDEWMNGEVHI